MKITMKVSLYDWSCDCCGSGEHYKIEIPELNLTYSENGQFGGKLNKDHNDIPGGEYWYCWERCKRYYEKNGYEVKVVM